MNEYIIKQKRQENAQIQIEMKRVKEVRKLHCADENVIESPKYKQNRVEKEIEEGK